MSENIFCPECGTKNMATSAFCMNCGSKLESPPSSSSPNYQQPTSNYQQPGYQQPPSGTGYSQPGYQQPSYPQPGYQGHQPNYGYSASMPVMDEYNPILYVCAFFIPIIGLVLWIANKDEKPVASKNILIASVVGFLILWVIPGVSI